MFPKKQSLGGPEVRVFTILRHNDVPGGDSAETSTMQRILVVDDEHLVADTLQLIFAKCGFDTRATYSTDEALACAEHFRPHLLLCDITMPERDGMELMEEMSRRQPNCRVLVLTGYYDNLRRVHEESSYLARPASVMVKPCQPAELLREAGLMLALA